MSQYMEFRRKLADLVEWAEDAGGMDYQEINQALVNFVRPDFDHGLRMPLIEDSDEPERNIEIELVQTCVFTRWRCTVCGDFTEKVSVLAEANDQFGVIRVCEFCLLDGNIDDRLRERVACEPELAPRLQHLIGKLNVPTFQEWEAAVALVHRNSFACTGVEPTEWTFPPQPKPYQAPNNQPTAA
jgi:hypothetical protein